MFFGNIQLTSAGAVQLTSGTGGDIELTAGAGRKIDLCSTLFREETQCL